MVVKQIIYYEGEVASQGFVLNHNRPNCTTTPHKRQYDPTFNGPLHTQDLLMRHNDWSYTCDCNRTYLEQKRGLKAHFEQHNIVYDEDQ